MRYGFYMKSQQLASLALLTCLSAFAGETTLRCEGKKYAVEARLPERERVQIWLGNSSVNVTKDAWVFAMNRRGEAIVPEEVVAMVSDPKLELRFENLRLCGDIDGVRVRIFEVRPGNRTFVEETACTCKAGR